VLLLLVMLLLLLVMLLLPPPLLLLLMMMMLLHVTPDALACQDKPIYFIFIFVVEVVRCCGRLHWQTNGTLAAANTSQCETSDLRAPNREW
jgi:hypothetical protein